MTSAIQDLGYQAIPIAASQIVDWKTQKAYLSHKHVARAAGLGWIGRNNLLVNEQFGSRIRLVTILTEIPLVTQYATTTGPRGFGTINIVPNLIKTTWAVNGETSQVTNTYDSGFTFPSPDPNQGGTFTGLYGKVMTHKEYDYGTTSGQPGPLLRQTNTSYAWQSPNPHYSNYLSNNMMNLVYSSQITDGTSQTAYTQYGHDGTATIASGMGATRASSRS